ncbi:glycosyl hydrolase family 88, partial [Alistipes sp. OttesenSCG-928-B03]|nr:glycosyl hydrolase family 88 [Alistipes sp. OttesenSCG-928-B03]
TGEVEGRKTWQGYSDNSTWARGQAWAIYGFTMTYRETRDQRYLDAATRAADWYLERLPEDMIPFWDFNVEQEGFTPDYRSYAVEYTGADKKDASAAAIVCSALFELAELSGNAAYSEKALAMLESLASPAYRAPVGENGGFMIMHCTGGLPQHVEIDVPLVYADYYFMESLVRYNKL